MKQKTSAFKKLLVFIILVMVSACSQNTFNKQPTASPDKITMPSKISDKIGPSNVNQTSKSQNMVEIASGLVPDNWALVEKVLEFTPENLYEHINGNAELYLAYDVVHLTFGSYLNSSNPNEFIDIFIYDMGSPTNAFGIFSVERFEGEPRVNLGRIAYQSSGSYFIWKGQYYIQVIASDDTEKLRQIGLDMATKTSHALNDSGESVWGLSAFPPEHLIPESIKFFLVDAMGLNFMKNTYTADYQKNGSRLKVFISQQSSLESARTIISQYAEYVQKYGKGIEKLTTDGIDLMACDMGEHYDVIFQKGQLTGGVLSVRDRSIAFKAAMDLWNQIPIGSEQQL